MSLTSNNTRRTRFKITRLLVFGFNWLRNVGWTWRWVLEVLMSWEVKVLLNIGYRVRVREI
jgi:hypothetical protein